MSHSPCFSTTPEERTTFNRAGNKINRGGNNRSLHRSFTSSRVLLVLCGMAALVSRTRALAVTGATRRAPATFPRALSSSARPFASGAAALLDLQPFLVATSPAPARHPRWLADVAPLEQAWLASSTVDKVSADPYQTKVQKLETDRQRNYTLNVGRCIETLRDEIPTLLAEAPTMDIFSDDVVLSDPNGALVRGQSGYAAFFAGLRMARRLSLVTPTVRILSLRHAERGEITVRFQVETPSPLGGAPLVFDALSVYKLNAAGLISEHKIDDVTKNELFAPGPALFQNLPRNLLWGAGMGQRVPMPMPF